MDARMSEACIQYQGKIELMAVAGCGRLAPDHEIMMFGIWKKKDNTNQMVCWKFDKVIFVYTNDAALTFKPMELKIECDANETIEG
jgi:hypothetical protein